MTQLRTNRNYVNLLLHSGQIEKIKRFKDKRLIVTQTEAIRRLIESGLIYESQQEAANGG